MEDSLIFIVNQFQQSKMKELWENKEDDFWDSFIEKLA